MVGKSPLNLKHVVLHAGERAQVVGDDFKYLQWNRSERTAPKHPQAVELAYGHHAALELHGHGDADVAIGVVLLSTPASEGNWLAYAGESPRPPHRREPSPSSSELAPDRRVPQFDRLHAFDFPKPAHIGGQLPVELQLELVSFAAPDTAETTRPYGALDRLHVCGCHVCHRASNQIRYVRVFLKRMVKLQQIPSQCKNTNNLYRKKLETSLSARRATAFQRAERRSFHRVC